ncbi:tRNA lysidine(34) synthetase TilS [Citrobacter amalonaticus]|uniref:tRNA lysidine(34) synthetase TilS n=1 Tax=Citrobacter amalonaticus TaxID=35703 RepID=UPI0018AB2D09|nr:tRNA lysidine(34) synthetase TilS [Citrobacter amalonaticus]MDT7069348.1 tRNA lysidine(34) synthetase TilS [Citrobacter amalonaticus]HCL5924185.1 tRNA lysidine(34) synthetase TilS [Citrobacter amalonaticus]HCW3113144.1 tRNA lysidine(34) synthetase TilS [Citrobacter amalonaticus]HEM7865586.1 tRNA lysidine(34) synthetase TilS [Citrobacter amalonaticus]
MTTLTLNTSLITSRQILVAFSGGLDSTVLLHQLVQWRMQQPTLSLRAMHIHHGLSAHADEWVAHCEAVCAQWQVPLVVERVTLVDAGLGIEAQARQARYQAFADALLPGEVLVTAQHLDDQCETFLLALKRGSGPAGLSAMAESAEFAGTLLIRPLLTQPRAALEQWAMQHQLRWIEDESNQDDAYDRNFLRLQVLPLLQQRWPHFADATARSAALCAEQESLLDELLADELSSCTTDNGTLELTPLMAMTRVRRAALLRRWLAAKNAPMPSRDGLERLWQEVALAREDASPCLRFGEYEVRRFQGQLWWIKSVVGQSETILPWPRWQLPLTLPAGLGHLRLLVGDELRAPHEDERVSIRFKAPGMLHIVGRSGGRKLKKIWQELNVPSWRRDTTPLLFYGETLIAAAGVFVTRDGAAGEESGVRLVWDQIGGNA